MTKLQQHLTTQRFTGHRAGPHLLITGGVHGDEFEPMAALRKLAGIVGELSSLGQLLSGTLTLVPCVNEDAFLLGRRCASDNLDLARTCPGKRNGSITEHTAALLSNLIQQADYYIDLHTGGTEYTILPLCGYMLHDDNGVLDAQRQMARAFGLPVIWGTSADLHGRSLSVARDAGVPAIYCEYGGSAVCSSEGVAAYVNGCLNVMAHLQMIGSRPPVTAADVVVEDCRHDSGHLQICNPSPVDGFFEPSVELGQKVSSGDTFGHVWSLADQQSHNLTVAHGGLVIMLRTFTRVRRNESVGVVLETAN